MDYPKSVPNVGLVGGKFVDENTTTGQVGSLIPATWGSAVTDEILNVIMSGGVAPEENQNDQLLLAIKQIIADNIPPEKVRTTLAEYGITDAYTKSKVYTKQEIDQLLKDATGLAVGTMVGIPVNKLPPGFLEIDGSVKSVAAYPDLAAFLGGAFNKGDEGAGNFRLPESRGEFLRGWDHGRGIDAGRAIGSYQLDALQNIKGDFTSRSFGGAAGAILGGTAPSPFSVTKIGSGVVGTTPLGAGGGTVAADVTTFDASLVARTSTETRGRNLAVMWCIKAWNAPINQGNIDIAALVPLAAQATEINQGTAKVATDAQMLDSANDAVIVTPKKLRLGFSISLTTNGYLVFPKWLGGLIVQWGLSPQIANNATITVPFTIGYPTACLFGLLTTSNTGDAGADAVPNIAALSPTNIRIFANDNAAGTSPLAGVYYLTFGH